MRVAPSAIRDVIAQASRLLHIEGFTVLGLDTDG